MAHALLQPTAVLVGDTDYAPDAFAARCLLSEAGKDDSKCSIRVCLFSLEAAKSNPARDFAKQSGIRVSLPGNSRSQVAKVTHFYRPASSCSRGGFGSHQIDK